jgi:uncharacterized membrane protein YciS (DUF1049 family)
MYIDQNVIVFVVGLIVGYMIRGTQHVIAKIRHERQLQQEYERIKAKAIVEKQFEARKLYPEQANQQASQ